MNKITSPDAQSNADENDNQNTITQQEIIVKVDQFKYEDKTQDVIDKLRSINKLFDRQRKLTLQKDSLALLKQQVLQMRGGKGGEDSFKDKSVQCRKVNSRLRLCNKMHKSTASNESAREAVKPVLDEYRTVVNQVKDTVLNRN